MCCSFPCFCFNWSYLVFVALIDHWITFGWNHNKILSQLIWLEYVGKFSALQNYCRSLTITHTKYRLFYCAIWECWPVLKSSGSLSFEEISLSLQQNCLSLGHVFLSFEQNSLSFGAISSILMLIFSWIPWVEIKMQT